MTAIFLHARHLLPDGTHADQQLYCLPQITANGLGKVQARQAVVAASACN
ncbi:hypothetical protein [Pseudomonas putida]|nr:hypothetical protein [Pseudomonas putida]